MTGIHQDFHSAARRHSLFIFPAYFLAAGRGRIRLSRFIPPVYPPTYRRTLPFRMARSPALTTSEGRAAFLNMAEFAFMEAACSNPVAVGPGKSAVTVTANEPMVEMIAAATSFIRGANAIPITMKTTPMRSSRMAQRLHLPISLRLRACSF